MAVVAIAVVALKAAAETSCKSWLLGICTACYTAEEQSRINADEAFCTLLRDPVRAAPELERRLRWKVRYWNGVLLIQDEILYGTTTLPASTPWSISCWSYGISVTFGPSDSDTTVDITPRGMGAESNACYEISSLLGPAVLKLTRGQ